MRSIGKIRYWNEVRVNSNPVCEGRHGHVKKHRQDMHFMI